MALLQNTILMASFYGHRNWYNCGNSNGSKGGYIAPDNTASVGENQRTNNVDIYPILLIT